MDYSGAIQLAAHDAGIDPAIALGVARRESGIAHYRKDRRWPAGTRFTASGVAIGTAGEIGIFQIKPGTAPGVNLEDPSQNIHAGVFELARLYRRFREWPLAVAAYNFGEGNVSQALAGRIAVPAQVSDYVAAVLGPGQLALSPSGKLASLVGPQLAQAAHQTMHTAVQQNPEIVIAGVLVGAALLFLSRK